MNEKYIEFIGNATGKLKYILDGIWSQNFKYDKKFVHYEHGSIDKYIPELKQRGFEIGTGVSWGRPTTYVSWE